MTDNRETIEMLKVLKEQSLKSHNDTAVLEVKIDSFNFVLDKAIEALEQESILDKIRAEIKSKIVKRPWLDFEDRERDRNDAFLEVLDIIDKYKAESEDKDIQLESDLLQKQTTNNCDNCFNGTTKGGCVIKELMKNKDCKYYMPQESEDKE